MERRAVYRDFLKIAPGETVTWQFDSSRACINARTLAYVTPREHPRAGVKRYSCRFLDGNILKVTAVPE